MNPKHCAHALRHGSLCNRARGPCRCGLPKHPDALSTARAVTRPPAEPPKPFKDCLTCGRTRPNTFAVFGKLMQGTRTNFVTGRHCKDCVSSAIARGLKNKP